MPDIAETGLWVTITDLACRKGVKPPTISARVTRLERDGLLTTRKGRGREKLVNLAEYDRVMGEVGNLPKQQAASSVRTMRSSTPVPRDAPSDPTFTDAQTQKALYDAAMKALDYAERTGELLPIAGQQGVAEAMAIAGEKIARVIKTLSHNSAELTGAAVKDGEVGTRRVLKTIERELLVTIGAAMRLVESDGKAHEAAGLCFVDLTVPDEVGEP